MRRVLRADSEGVASAVAAMLCLLVAVLLIQIAVIQPSVEKQSQADWITYTEALSTLRLFRSLLVAAAMPGATFSLPIPLGTAAVSPFISSSPGSLQFNSTSAANATVSFSFVPQFKEASVTKIDQDIVLDMDMSGSMSWNDPTDLRIDGAQEYVGQLAEPDRIAIVAFNHQAFLTRTHIGGQAHHLSSNFAQAQADLGTIGHSGNTNIGGAIALANSELIANGNPHHAWVQILLTDGQNQCVGQPCGDAYTLQMAWQAKAYNITIYTIGLSDEADANLLTQVATITGGTFYSAPTAASIRWIYYEISRRYTGAFLCSQFAAQDAFFGSLDLQLRPRNLPTQTFRMDGPAIVLDQSDGEILKEGPPIVYLPLQNSSGSLSLVIITFVGDPFLLTGIGYASLQARVLARQLTQQSIVKVDLASESNHIGGISSEFQYWTNQGAATPDSAVAVRAPINHAQAASGWAAANVSAGDVVSAKFNVDRAQADLSTAITVLEQYRSQGKVQNWLAAATRDDILASACRLDQWRNWYEGISIDLYSGSAAAWSQWFNTTFAATGVPIDIGVFGNESLIRVHAIDTFILDYRVIELSASG